jgi:hypothetical protein
MKVDWLDNSRDLMKMFADFDIPQPVIGMGHSMGGAQMYCCPLTLVIFVAHSRFYAAICQPPLSFSMGVSLLPHRLDERTYGLLSLKPPSISALGLFIADGTPVV